MLRSALKQSRTAIVAPNPECYHRIPEINPGNTMQITVNGETRQLPESLTIEQLVGLLELKRERVAVELNRSIVSRREWGEVRLNTGDILEIVHFVGGG
jgi:thiamine biosynthesis protein ThiS